MPLYFSKSDYKILTSNDDFLEKVSNPGGTDKLIEYNPTT